MRICMLLAFVVACGGSKSPPPAQPDPSGSATSVASDCVKSGCSGTVCVEPGKEVVTTCEYKAEYACYRDAKCERQGDGACGWTQTPELTSCLANPPPMDTGPAPQ